MSCRLKFKVAEKQSKLNCFVKLISRLVQLQNVSFLKMCDFIEIVKGNLQQVGFY